MSRWEGRRFARFGSSELLVLVVAEPGHKHATTPAQTRLELTRLAFEDLPEAVVELDEHARTVDSLEARRPADAYFVLGSDELAAFETWKSPERVLELVRLAVATRPGVDRAEVESVRRRLAAPDRIVEFDMDPVAGLVVGDSCSCRTRRADRRLRPREGRGRNRSARPVCDA